jgi:hypothetical protein
MERAPKSQPGSFSRSVRHNNMMNKRGHIAAFQKNNITAKQTSKRATTGNPRRNFEVQTVIFAGAADLRIAIPFNETRFTIPGSPTNANIAFEHYCNTHEHTNDGKILF